MDQKSTKKIVNNISGAKASGSSLVMGPHQRETIPGPRASAVTFSTGSQSSAVKIACQDIFIHSTSTHYSVGSHVRAGIFVWQDTALIRDRNCSLKTARNDASGDFDPITPNQFFSESKEHLYQLI